SSRPREAERRSFRGLAALVGDSEVPRTGLMRESQRVREPDGATVGAKPARVALRASQKGSQPSGLSRLWPQPASRTTHTKAPADLATGALFTSTNPRVRTFSLGS